MTIMRENNKYEDQASNQEVPEYEARAMKLRNHLKKEKETFLGLKGLIILQTKYTEKEPYGGTVCHNFKF